MWPAASRQNPLLAGMDVGSMLPMPLFLWALSLLHIGSGLLPLEGDAASHPQVMHCPFEAQLEGLRRVWCKKSSDLCCLGMTFSNDTQQLEEGAVSVQQDRGTFNLTIWRLGQGEGTYWCGLLDRNNMVIKLAESYLHSPVPPQGPGHLWSLLRWVLMPLLPLVAATVHLCSNHRNRKTSHEPASCPPVRVALPSTPRSPRCWTCETTKRSESTWAPGSCRGRREEPINASGGNDEHGVVVAEREDAARGHRAPVDMDTPRKAQGSSPSSLMELSFQPPLKAFEDLTLDSGYGGMAGSCRSSVLSLSPSHLDTPPPGALWTLREAVGRDSGGKGLAGRETWATLPLLEWAPWTEEQLGAVMRRSLPSWRLSPHLLRQVSVRLGRALQRMALEAQRLSLRCGKCTKQEVQTAARLLLSWAMAEAFVGAGVRALSQYSMSVEDPWTRSKSALCGLDLSVGRVFRWIVEAHVAPLVHEHAAIYLAAGLQALLEVLCSRMGRAPPDHKGALSQAETEEAEQQALERLIDADAELWGLFQPYQHLMCGRNAYGVLVLPSYLSVYSRRSLGRAGRVLAFRMSELQTLESSLLSTTVDSVSELSALVINTMYCLQRLTFGSSSAVNRPPFHQRALCWEPAALHTLFYYTHVQREEGQHSPEPRGPQLSTERPEAWLPPLCEWLRVCVALAEHRHSLTVDSGDVQQAARLLLPGVDVEPRPLRVECCLYASKRLEAPLVKRVLCWNLAFRMLTCGRTDLVASAVALLGPDGVNTLDQQGLSPLMYTCANGDEAMVQVLLDSGASVNLQVPGSAQSAPCAHPETRHWTALSFAVAFGHTSVAQLLLDHGADADGCAREEGAAETPLQLAAAAGRYPLVSLLLERGADPLSGTSSVIGGSSSLRGMTTAFSLAAAHGHRTVLWTLLSTINSDMVSLEDMLAEGLVSRGDSDAQSGRSSHARRSALQGALYHSAEHGFLDIAVQLQQRENVPWTLHSWLQCLRTSFSLQRWDVTHSLLGDFPTLQDVYGKELVCDGLPLLFNILNTCQSESTVHQLAAILSRCYGPFPVPAVHESASKPHTPLDPVFLNNKEMCDITFLVEDKPFYGHRELVSSACPGLEKLISQVPSSGSTPVEVADVKYSTFQLVMQYIYSGGVQGIHMSKQEAMEVLHAAHVFGLKVLKRHCEMLCSKCIYPSDAASVYRQAKAGQGFDDADQASELKRFCEGYFLKNMVALLDVSSFRRLLLASEEKDTLGKDLLHTLTVRMQALGQPVAKETMV